MITVNIREEDEFIKLGQALKKAGLVGSGGLKGQPVTAGQGGIHTHAANTESVPAVLRLPEKINRGGRRRPRRSSYHGVVSF